MSNWPQMSEIPSPDVDVTYFFRFIVDLEDIYNERATFFC